MSVLPSQQHKLVCENVDILLRCLLVPDSKTKFSKFQTNINYKTKTKRQMNINTKKKIAYLNKTLICEFGEIVNVSSIYGLGSADLDSLETETEQD